MLYAFFCVILRRLILYADVSEHCSETSAYKIQTWGITQKKAYKYLLLTYLLITYLLLTYLLTYLLLTYLLLTSYLLLTYYLLTYYLLITYLLITYLLITYLLLTYLFTYYLLITYLLLTYLLTPCSTVLETLTCSQLVKKFLTFYGTRKFITAFTSARHLSLS